MNENGDFFYIFNDEEYKLKIANTFFIYIFNF